MVVALKAHGGSCCGARHIHGFDSGTEAALDTINTALAQAPTRRAVEVILNGSQVGRYPGILGRLAQLGFVYDGHWKNGNHDSDNYRFTRCDDRRPLTLAGWTGMVMDPALTGTLPALPGQTTAGGGVGVVRDLTHYVRPLPENAAANALTRRNTLVREGGGGRRGQGVRYRINSPRSRYNGQEFICLGSGGGAWDRQATWRFRHPVDGVFEISQNNCSVAAVQDEGARPEWDRAFVVGDRVQVARIWDRTRYPVGLCGTVVRADPVSIDIQFDPEGYAVMNSSLEYIHLVLPGTQPDVPRECIQPPAGVAPAVVPDQRHTLDADYPRTYPIPAAPAPGAAVPRTPDTFVVGERVAYVNGTARPHGCLGTVTRISGRPPEILYHVNWDGEGQGTGCYGRRLRLAEAPPAPPPPAPEVREVRIDVPVEPPRTIIASTYHCVFRNGNRGAGYDTLGEAQAALGRRTRIDRRDFFNTAPHMRWAENVPY